MLRDEYKRVYADICPSPALLQRTERKALQMRNGGQIARRALRTALLAALLLALLAALAAAATNSDILAKLFGEKEPPAETAAKLQTKPAEEADGGVTLTIDEYLNDGSGVHATWTVRSDREGDAYYGIHCKLRDVGTDEEPSFAYGAVTTSDVWSMVGSLTWLNPSQPEYHGYVDLTFDAGSLDPAARYELILTLYAFESDFAPLSTDDWGRRGDEAVARLEAERKIEFYERYASDVRRYSAYQSALRRIAGEGLADEGERMARAFEESGVARRIATLETRLTFSLDGASLVDIAPDEEFVFADRALVLHRLTADRMSISAEYTLYCDVPHDEVEIFNDVTCYSLLLPDGSLLRRSGGGNGSGSVSEKEYPYLYRHDCRYTYAWAGDVPEYVTFIPNPTSEAPVGDETDAECAARLIAAAGEENCFRVSLR